MSFFSIIALAAAVGFAYAFYSRKRRHDNLLAMTRPR